MFLTVWHMPLWCFVQQFLNCDCLVSHTCWRVWKWLSASLIALSFWLFYTRNFDRFLTPKPMCVCSVGLRVCTEFFSTVSGCISETVQDRDIHLVCNTNAAVSVMVICTDCAVPACSMSQDGCSLLHCQEQGTTWPRCPSQNSNMPCSYASQRVSNSSVLLMYWCML